MTDARPDTGGLSGATPAEAVSWGKIDPDQLPGHGGRLHRQLDRAAAAHGVRPGQARAPGRSSGCTTGAQAMMDRLVEEYRAALAFRDERAEESLAHMHPGAGGAETAARR